MEKLGGGGDIYSKRSQNSRTVEGSSMAGDHNDAMTGLTLGIHRFCQGHLSTESNSILMHILFIIQLLGGTIFIVHKI